MGDAGLDDVFIDDITFPAVDGYLLGATLFLPRGVKRHAVLINSATAVPRKIYRGFAGYLARRGCAVLTYDYRGIGNSRQKALVGFNQPKSLAGFKASMSDWAVLDVTAAVAWMRERYHGLPLSYVGHSFGGQALGLIPNNIEVSRALLIGAQAGYWKLFAVPERYRVYVFLKFVGIPLTRLLGYAPGWSGLGEDLPKDVFLQWVGWVMSKRYFFDDPRLPALKHFAHYHGALRALCLSDDPWATRPAVELLCSEFTSTKPEIITITPADADVAKIGHFGFFSRRTSRYAVAERGGMDSRGGVAQVSNSRPSLRSNPFRREKERWIVSSRCSSQRRPDKTPRSRGACRPRFALSFLNPPIKRAQGRPGAQPHPWVPCK